MVESQFVGLLHQLKQDAYITLDTAANCMRADCSLRNRRAREAAADHRNRADELLGAYNKRRVPQDVIPKLTDNREHAEDLERQFSRWARFSKFDNEYAKSIHSEAAERYKHALNVIENMPLDIHTARGRGRSSLYLVFSNRGGSSDQYLEEFEITEGIESTTTLSAELSTEIIAKASASGDILSAKYRAEMDGKFGIQVKAANVYISERSMTRKVRLTIDLSKPCYIYQMQSEVDLTNAETVVLWGGYFISNIPLKEIKSDGKIIL